MSTSTLRLRGHRSVDHTLLTWHWQPGELLARSLDYRPVVAEPITVAPAGGRSDQRFYLVDGLAFVRFVELDWIHRRARLEIGVQPGVVDELNDLVGLAVEHGFGPLNLHRLYGWVTPAVGTPTEPLVRAGFLREALVPQATWLNGEPVDRQLWGVLRDD